MKSSAMSVLINADTGLPDLNISTTFLHLLIVNIPGNKVNEGQTISPYFIPLPFPLTGKHRYIILVYRQLEKIDTSEKSPPLFGFDINAYVKSHNLQGPRYGYFFIVGSSRKEVLEKIRSYFSS
ncbi:hypothetical protein AVEN_142368-1 [Araneus ventricosus]|uniref:Uncharacterized protein n=1 Tax=Araneus ventricosus TaxID=182803 RepID=A0A4Y2SCG3_ARAVE|nr:hypothetical protein AVEN_142368-1 [Araneus ventricosus]